MTSVSDTTENLIYWPQNVTRFAKINLEPRMTAGIFSVKELFYRGAMRNSSKRFLIFMLVGFFHAAVHAQNLDQIGMTLLRAVTTNLNGAGIRVAQPEAGY